MAIDSWDIAYASNGAFFSADIRDGHYSADYGWAIYVGHESSEPPGSFTFRSTDGVNWVYTDQGDIDPWFSVAASNTRWVAGKYPDVNGVSGPPYVPAVYSVDGGVSWSQANDIGSERGEWWGAAYSAAGGFFSLVGSNKTSDIALKSTDGGVNWTTHAMPAGEYVSLVYAPGLNLLIAIGDGVCATSSDGETWTSRAIPNFTWHDIAWSEALGLAVVVGDTVPSPFDDPRVAVSADGINWALHVVPTTTYSVRWSDGENQFLAAAFFDPINPFPVPNVLLSNDGTNWSEGTPNTHTDTSLTYGGLVVYMENAGVWNIASQNDASNVLIVNSVAAVPPSRYGVRRFIDPSTRHFQQDLVDSFAVSAEIDPEAT